MLAQASEYTWMTRTWTILLRKLNLIKFNHRTLNLILSANLFFSLCRVLLLNPGARGKSHQPAFMGRLAISHTGLPCLLSRYPLMIGLNGGSFDLFFMLPWYDFSSLGSWCWWVGLRSLPRRGPHGFAF